MHSSYLHVQKLHNLLHMHACSRLHIWRSNANQYTLPALSLCTQCSLVNNNNYCVVSTIWKYRIKSHIICYLSPELYWSFRMRIAFVRSPRRLVDRSKCSFSLLLHLYLYNKYSHPLHMLLHARLFTEKRSALSPFSCLRRAPNSHTTLPFNLSFSLLSLRCRMPRRDVLSNVVWTIGAWHARA